MTEDPPTPQDDETPDAAGDVAEPEQSADPSESPAEEQPAAEAEEQPAAEAEQPAPEEPAEAPAPEAVAPAAEAPVEEEKPKPKPREREKGDAGEPEVVPGAHLEPDLVLEASQESADEYGAYAQTYDESGAPTESEGPEAATEEGAAEQPVARKPLDLAADARYIATGKRKTAVARVILKPGTGAYTINGRELDTFFPRLGLQRTARGPLETAGYESRMDVVAKIHGGGVSAQAGALRHGVARALVDADPNLRSELKRRGFLTRDARAKERKKA